jgi:putative FmdB family regulatory protein
MPLYEYECKSCHHVVEVLVRHATGERDPNDRKCPECGSAKLDRVLSVTASPMTKSGSSLPMASGAESCGMPRCCGGGCKM